MRSGKHWPTRHNYVVPDIGLSNSPLNVNQMLENDFEKTPHLMGYVETLEGKDSIARGCMVESLLESLGIAPAFQECRYPRIKNIIVDFSPAAEKKRLVFSAHYDSVKGSPAANDNASGVAVLLGLCQRLKGSRAPVRVVFFDREEAWFRTPLIRLGLLGSLNYVFRNDISDIAAVYNLEFCGQGESLVAWPVKRNKKHLPVIKELERAVKNLRLGLECVHIPWVLLSSDHFSFRFRGFSNSVTLTLLPTEEIPLLKKMIPSLSIPGLLFGRKPTLPGVLADVHTAGDTSSQLSESSLRLMLSVLLELINVHGSTSANS